MSSSRWRLPESVGSVAARFRAGWAGPHDRDAGSDAGLAAAELLPVRLAQACVQVLPVAGAGLSLFTDQFRVPLGASDSAAAAVERMQFTHGEGPCLTAAGTGEAALVGVAEMQARWPSFAADLLEHSAFRAVLSLPLPVGPELVGAVDLYLYDQADVAGLALVDVLSVTAQMVDALLVAPTRLPAMVDEGRGPEPAWLSGPTARERTQAWIAVGIVMAHHNLDAADALALLRSYAYGHDTELDQVVDDVLAGRIPVEAIDL